MNWKQRYSIAARGYSYLAKQAERFHSSGGSIEIHHTDSLQGPNEQLSDYFAKQSASLKSKGSIGDDVKDYASSTLSSYLDDLSKTYGSGQAKQKGTKVVIAKDKDGNVTGAMPMFGVGQGQWANVLGAASISPGSASALQHGAIHGLLKGTKQGLGSEVYSKITVDHTWTDRDDRIQSNAMNFHKRINRNVAWQDGTDVNTPEGVGSWWTPGNIRDIVSQTTLPNQNIKHIGKQ